jgi:hypothetical protein
MIKSKSISPGGFEILLPVSRIRFLVSVCVIFLFYVDKSLAIKEGPQRIGAISGWN